jgi:hypothetical protein
LNRADWARVGNKQQVSLNLTLLNGGHGHDSRFTNQIMSHFEAHASGKVQLVIQALPKACLTKRIMSHFVAHTSDFDFARLMSWLHKDYHQKMWIEEKKHCFVEMYEAQKV